MGSCAVAGTGGAYTGLAGVGSLLNCTFAGNAAECDGAGGGVWGVIGPITNCVFWNNTDADGSLESSQITGGLPTVNYSCIQGLTGLLGGEGNIGLDPLFVDPAGPDGVVGTEDDELHLAAASPCIDAADNTTLPPEVLTDLDGNPRFVDDPGTADTGVGEPPIVDMGAHEFQGVPCTGDLNGDFVVDVVDLLALLEAWGTSGTGGADINGDGIVDVADLTKLLAAWGPC